VFIDIVDYSKIAVSEQILIRERFKSLLTLSLKGIDPQLRLVLDTGNGAAVSFLGNAQDALMVSIRMRDYLKAANGAPVIEPNPDDLDRTISLFNYALRIGVNLGPVKLQQDNHGHPQIVGDGINVAQRITSFAEADQIVVSQSYFDAVSVVSAEYTKLLSYEGSRTDKNVRDHEIYAVRESNPIANPIDNAAAVRKVKEVSAKSGDFVAVKAIKPMNAAAIDVTLTDKDKTEKLTEKVSEKTSDNAKESNAKSKPGIRKYEQPTGAATAFLNEFLNNRNKLFLTGSILAFVVAALLLALLIRKSANKTIPAIETAASEPTAAAAKSELPGIAAAGPTTSLPLSGFNTEIVPPAGVPLGLPSNMASGEETRAAFPPAIPPTDTKSSLTALPTAAKSVVKPVPKPVVARGTVSFSVQPWGDVYLNGKSVGASPPLKQSRLAPGTYTVVIKNTTFTPYILNVEVKSGEEVNIMHKFP
jgi:hypothetical protein